MSFSFFVSLFCRTLVPFARFVQIDFDAHSFFIAKSNGILCVGIPLRRRPHKPIKSDFGILVHTDAVHKETANFVLSVRVAVLRRLQKPICRGFVVLLDIPPLVQILGKVVLRFGNSAARRLLVIL